MNKDFYPSINMLRGIAALMVCFFHFTTYSGINGSLFDASDLIYQIGGFGDLGVFVFFIITGFVIPLSLMKYDFKLNQIHSFLAKRWLRIEIPYLVSIVLVLFVALAFSLRNNTSFSIDISRLSHHLFYTASFFHHEWYNPIYWTLAIEMQFYIFIALVYPLLKFDNNNLNCLLPMAFALSALLIVDNRLVFHYGAIFSQGILLLLIFKNKLSKDIGILCILISSIITGFANGMDIAIASLLTVGVIAFTNLDKKIFNWLGEISYSLYLIHGIVGVNAIYFLERYTSGFLSKILLVVIAFILSISAAFIYWKLIENTSKTISKKIKL